MNLYLTQDFFFNVEKINFFPFGVSFCELRGASQIMNFYGIKKAMSDAEFNIIAKSDQILSNIDEISSDDATQNINNGIFIYFTSR